MTQRTLTRLTRAIDRRNAQWLEDAEPEQATLLEVVRKVSYP